MNWRAPAACWLLSALTWAVQRVQARPSRKMRVRVLRASAGEGHCQGGGAPCNARSAHALAERHLHTDLFRGGVGTARSAYEYSERIGVFRAQMWAGGTSARAPSPRDGVRCSGQAGGDSRGRALVHCSVDEGEGGQGTGNRLRLRWVHSEQRMARLWQGGRQVTRVGYNNSWGGQGGAAFHGSGCRGVLARLTPARRPP